MQTFHDSYLIVVVHTCTYFLMKYSQSKRAITLFKKWSCQTALMIKHIFMVMRNSIPLKLNLTIILKNLLKVISIS